MLRDRFVGVTDNAVLSCAALRIAAVTVSWHVFLTLHQRIAFTVVATTTTTVTVMIIVFAAAISVVHCVLQAELPHK